jgi:transposase
VKKKAKYTKQPESDAEIQERLLWVLRAMLGEVDKSEAAKQLGLSRTQLHNLVNQTAQALVDSVTPKKAGRPARSATEKELEEDNERLRRENERLRQRVETVDRLLGVASDMMKGRVQATGRSKKKTTATSGTAEKPEDEEPDGASELLRGVREMRALGLPAPLAAAVAGVSPQTITRWARNERRGLPLRRKRGGGPAPLCSPEAAAKAQVLVRELRGQVGATTLSKTAGRISRREAGRVKQETLTTMERERKANMQRVLVAVPGVIRGFDAMYVATRQGTRYALIAADACVPFRTSAIGVESYDSAAVARTIERDIRKYGAPLVYRLDRASCHRTDEVDEVLAAAGVLRLHGPPHHPRFYGQLERQNREHRAWLAAGPELDVDNLPVELEQMRCALNAVRPRPTLSYQTAEDMWDKRPELREDRSALREAVTDSAARIARRTDQSRIRGSVADFPQRIAIEQALSQRGYLDCQFGGWC